MTFAEVSARGWPGRTRHSPIIGRMLGHKTAQTTMVYSRLAMDPLREAVNKATDAMLLAGGQTKLIEQEDHADGEECKTTSTKRKPDGYMASVGDLSRRRRIKGQRAPRLLLEFTDVIAKGAGGHLPSWVLLEILPKGENRNMLVPWREWPRRASENWRIRCTRRDDAEGHRGGSDAWDAAYGIVARGTRRPLFQAGEKARRAGRDRTQHEEPTRPANGMWKSPRPWLSESRNGANARRPPIRRSTKT